MKLGILVYFDPAMGKIKSEILLLNDLVRLLKPEQVQVIAVMQRASSLLAKYDLDFRYQVVAPDDAECDVVVTWNCTNTANFFGGMISPAYTKYYKQMSRFTNQGMPVIYRAGDSENNVYDYRDVVLKRAEADEKFVKNNQELVDQLRATPRINYDQLYLLVNGERDKFDWVPDTYLVRKPMEHFTQKICDQALYLGDDLCFQVLEKYHTEMQLRDGFRESLFWIGFIEHRNAGRKKVFKELLPNIGIPVTIQTTSDFEVPGIDCVNQGIEGDTPEYFRYLSEWLGYVFIGKGTDKCSYVNKTVYDCFIARVPVLVYEKTDQTRMIFPDHPEFYFSDQAGLVKLFKQLLDPATRKRWVEAQAEHLKQRLTNVPDRERLKDLFKVTEPTSKSLLEF